MKKGKYTCRVILVLTAIQCITVCAHEKKEGWISYVARSVGHKMSNAYRYFFIPHTRLLSSSNFVLEIDHHGTSYTIYNCFVFQYDVSGDSDTVKNLRKKLNISGFYLQDGWKISDGKQHWRPMYNRNSIETKNREILDRAGITVSQLYKERGFDEKIDNSIVTCLERLFDEIVSTLRTCMTLKSISRIPAENQTESNGKRIQLAATDLRQALKEKSDNEKAWMQLLWELENAIVQQKVRDFSITSYSGLNFVLDGLPHSKNRDYIPAIWQQYTYYFYQYSYDYDLIRSQKKLDDLLGLREEEFFPYLNNLFDLASKRRY